MNTMRAAAGAPAALTTEGAGGGFNNPYIEKSRFPVYSSVDGLTIQDLRREYPLPSGYEYVTDNAGNIGVRDNTTGGIFSIVVEEGVLTFNNPVYKNGRIEFDTTEVFRRGSESTTAPDEQQANFDAMLNWVDTRAGDINLGYQGMDAIEELYDINREAIWPKYGAYMNGWLAEKMAQTHEVDPERAYSKLGSWWEQEVPASLEWAKLQGFSKKDGVIPRAFVPASNKKPYTYKQKSDMFTAVADWLKANGTVESDYHSVSFRNKVWAAAEAGAIVWARTGDKEAGLAAAKEAWATQKVGGGLMNTLEQRLSETERIAQRLNQRVTQADTDQMIDQRLQASALPMNVQEAIRGQLMGKQVAQEEVDQFIKFQQGISDHMASVLARNAGVTLEGGFLPENDGDTIDGALKALFDSQKK